MKKFCNHLYKQLPMIGMTGLRSGINFSPLGLNHGTNSLSASCRNERVFRLKTEPVLKYYF